MPTTRILGEEYYWIQMPDGRYWTVQNVTYAPLQQSSDSVGSLFTQEGTNDLNDALLGTGWRVPTNSDWYSMGASLPGSSWLDGGGYTSSGHNVPFYGRFVSVGAKLKEPSGWLSPYNVPPYASTNEFGFSAKMHDDLVQRIAIWRSYYPDGGGPVWFVADNTDSFLREGAWSSSSGLHVRLVRDTPPGFSGVRPAQSGAWRNASEVHVAKDGVWRKANRIFAPVSGAWREVQ